MVRLFLAHHPPPSPHPHLSRTRKIRCDGVKPDCHNCTRRAKPTDPCTYDNAPKRRGPDKTPGTRQRMACEAQESDADPVASRRSRRKRRDTTLPPTGTSSSTPSLVLDPQLANILPFQPAPAPPPLLTGPEALISNPLPVLSDSALYDMTSQVFTYSSPVADILIPLVIKGST